MQGPFTGAHYPALRTVDECAGLAPETGSGGVTLAPVGLVTEGPASALLVFYGSLLRPVRLAIARVRSCGSTGLGI